MNKSFAYAGIDAAGAVVVPRLLEAGFKQIHDLAKADAIITYWTSQTALEDAYFDESGIVQMAQPGTLLIDLSASTPSFARELNAVAVVSDLLAVDAPLIVIDLEKLDAFADKANLACLVSGDEAATEAALPFLNAIVGDVQDTGGSGSAQLARAAYTLQAVAQVISAVEADALYRAVGRSSVTIDQRSDHAGAATPLAEQVLEAIRAHRFNGTYTVEMFMAELSAALMAADDVDLILPQAEACLHLLELLAVIGGSDKAPAALSLVYGEEAVCAEQGLDWTRAEQAYGDGYDDDDDGHHHDSSEDYPDYPGYSGYSAN